MTTPNPAQDQAKRSPFLRYATEQASPNEQGHLLHNLILFGRVLHGMGLPVSLARVMDVAQALEYVQLGRKTDFYFTLRSLMVSRKEDLALFDQAFRMFWRAPVDQTWQSGMPVLRQKKRKKPIIKAPPLKEKKDDGSGQEPKPDEPPVIEVTLTYSDNEVLRTKDFADMTGEEIEEVKRLMTHLLWRMGERRTRRLRPGNEDLIDMRRTLRQNLRYGGEILTWSQRAPKFKPRPLVMLADISGSMERYTRLLLHFVYSITQALRLRGKHPMVESFVFGTHLTRVTRQLTNKDIDIAIKEVGHAVNDWSGGTRIGESLKQFNFKWGRRVLGRGAIVLIISDGWDRGDVKLLGDEMARLHRNAHRVIWLNPLLGMADYEPLTRGIQAVLPHIDDFMPVHNLASLQDLASHLEKLKIP